MHIYVILNLLLNIGNRLLPPSTGLKQSMTLDLQSFLICQKQKNRITVA